jgi:hypothetical protein
MSRTGWVLAVALAALPASAAAQSDSGVAMLVGSKVTGFSYGLGLNYYQQLGRRPWYLVPHADGGLQVTEKTGAMLYWDAGLLLVRGNVHRAVLAMDYAVVGEYPRYLHGTLLWWKKMAGPRLGLGYELSRRRYLFQLIPAVTYVLGVLPPQEHWSFSLLVSAGWKLW